MLPIWGEMQGMLEKADPVRPVGRVSDMVGMVIEVRAMAGPIGSLCRIERGRNMAPVVCEVVGFRKDNLLLMPLQDGAGISPGQAVSLVASRLTVPVGEGLLGRVIDGLADPWTAVRRLGRCLALPWEGTHLRP